MDGISVNHLFVFLAAPHWCSCLHWEPIKVDTDEALKLAISLVAFINDVITAAAAAKL